MMGVIEGGEEFVKAGYGLTWSVFAIYAITLFFRIKKAKKEYGK